MISSSVLFIGFILLTVQRIGNCSHGLNLDGSPLELCSTDPMTGFTRNGYCETNEFDQGKQKINFINKSEKIARFLC